MRLPLFPSPCASTIRHATHARSRSHSPGALLASSSSIFVSLLSTSLRRRRLSPDVTLVTKSLASRSSRSAIARRTVVCRSTRLQAVKIFPKSRRSPRRPQNALLPSTQRSLPSFCSWHPPSTISVSASLHRPLISAPDPEIRMAPDAPARRSSVSQASFAPRWIRFCRLSL